MSDSIRLSPKHGVNPAIPHCFFCGEPKNEVILAGYMRGDREAPHGAVWDKEPCEACVSFMKQGIILIETENGADGMDNPPRTGNFAVVKDVMIERAVNNSEIQKAILKKRMAFVVREVWDKLGLPRNAPESPGEEKV